MANIWFGKQREKLSKYELWNLLTVPTFWVSGLSAEPLRTALATSHRAEVKSLINKEKVSWYYPGWGEGVSVGAPTHQNLNLCFFSSNVFPYLTLLNFFLYNRSYRTLCGEIPQRDAMVGVRLLYSIYLRKKTAGLERSRFAMSSFFRCLIIMEESWEQCPVVFA